MATRPKSRTARLADAIASAVASGELAPGVLLPSSRRLAEATGTSVGVVAGAIRDLAARGILVPSKGGPVVAPASTWNPRLDLGVPAPGDVGARTEAIARIVDTLSEEIATQALAPGEKVSFRATARRFKCGNPCVSAAFAVLSERGLIVKVGAGNAGRWVVA